MDHNIKILIGIDVSKNKQDICIKNNNGKVLKRLEIMGTREAQCALHILGVCAIKPINGKIPQMAYWESDQPIVPTKQGNACGGKGLTVEPLGQGHIHRTQMRVKDGNKTVPITYPPKKKRGMGRFL
ncbi:hypothetical protein C5S42_03990 [Candidatus Methanomarinus sp.]|nr:hypothetical protein C5S42_03990 [ANME-2 cluster archaeon]